MADPTNNLVQNTALPAFSVKPCTGPYQNQSVSGINQAQDSRRQFGNSIGKIGDLQVLNSIGGGSIGTGLRTLAGASNAIRTGCGSLPTSIGSTIDQGANWVLQSVGITPDVIKMLEPLNPGVANAAWGNAQQIYSRIKQGHFKATDIPSYLQSFQDLERLARGIYTPGNDRLNSLSPRCQAFPYAEDLLPRAPKYKFLFLVQFKLMPGFLQYQDASNNMAFVVKKSTRPHVKYVTEDVNYYNFRTKVITKTDFEEMTMSFHDDNMGMVHTFYAMCIRALSPITNNTNWTSPDVLENDGLNFPNGEVTGPTYSASLGPLPGDSKQQIFQEITLYHVVDYGRNVDVYHFFNPHITQLQPDDVDMAESTCNELSMTFHYDYVHMENVPAQNIDLEGMQPGAMYPLRYNGNERSVQGPNTNSINPFGQPAEPPSCNTLNTQNLPSSSATGPFNGGFGAGI
jgi:hypothetical protein